MASQPTIKERLSVIETKLTTITEKLSELSIAMKKTQQEKAPYEDLSSFKQEITKLLDNVSQKLENTDKVYQKKIEKLQEDYLLIRQNLNSQMKVAEKSQAWYRKVMLTIIPLIVTSGIAIIIEFIQIFHI